MLRNSVLNIQIKEMSLGDEVKCGECRNMHAFWSVTFEVGFFKGIGSAPEVQLSLEVCARNPETCM